MRFEVVLPAELNATARAHLLQHYSLDLLQEDLCFALWRPSTGRSRYTAIIAEILLPTKSDRLLHGNVSFTPEYLVRALTRARKAGFGLAFMHSHPTTGWQEMSTTDVEAEQNILAYPAETTGLPLLGMTIGADGFWSARFWKRHGLTMRRLWCAKVRVIEPHVYRVYHNDRLNPPAPRRRVLRRTIDTWGAESQQSISRLSVGIVGLGSVGSIVAEAIARIGVEQITLIDPDRIEEHNLDRLFYSTEHDIGKHKVSVAAGFLRRHATAHQVHIDALPLSIHHRDAYGAALSCDVIFSCVDRPMARDVLNFVAHAHLIPVIDGGVAIETDTRTSKLFSAHWRAQIVTPYHQCLRCSRQYDSSMVVVELDGFLDTPAYIANLPESERNSNQNVFPFALSVAGMQVNLMLRYLLSVSWWPSVYQQEHQFVLATTSASNAKCHAYCSFRQRRGAGDAEIPHYLVGTSPSDDAPVSWYRRLIKALGRKWSTSRFAAS